MHFLKFFTALATLLILAGCSTTNNRIQSNPSVFNASTPTEQAMIKAGQIDIGFTQEQAALALGKPDNEKSVETTTGKQLVWEYRKIDPNLGFSLGIGSWGRGLNTGVGVNSRPANSNVTMRVYFDRKTGDVSKVEKFK